MSSLKNAASSKPTRADDVHRTLKEEIMHNRLPPGSQATEPELSLRLGVSRTTIREALIRLEAEGLVKMIPRRGARILPLLSEDMREIYQILIVLESEAAADLAARKLGSDDLAQLQSATDEMSKALEDGDLENWAEADDRFHRAFLDLHGNRRLANIARGLSDQAHRARVNTLRLRQIPEVSIEEHRKIIQAIKDADPDAARQAYRAHRERAAQEIMTILEKLNHL